MKYSFITLGLLATALSFGQTFGKAVIRQGKQDTCYALAMSGGAVKGAYEAGVLWGFYHQLEDKSKMAYDVVTGVSAGAINGGAMALFEIGDEKNMVETLSMRWQLLTSDQLYAMWEPLGIVTGVIRESGVLDTSPLLKFVEDFFKEFGPDIRRRLVVSSVDAINGDYVLFNETTEEPSRAILSSASIPFAFPKQDWTIGGQQVVAFDGGSVWNTNLVSAVQRCLEIVDDESQVTLDIIQCSGYQVTPWNERGDTLNNVLRFQDIKGFRDNTADILEFKEAFPKVNFRYWVAPKTSLSSGAGMLDADNATSTFPMQLTGREDGAEAVKAGEGFMFKQMEKWISDSKIQSEYPVLGDYLQKVNIEDKPHFKSPQNPKDEQIVDSEKTEPAKQPLNLIQN